MADTDKGNEAPHNRGKKRSKSYYIRAKEGKRIRKDTMLSVGMRGVMLTCNHGVKPCVKEAYNLLAEYADKMYGPEKDLDDANEDQSPDEDDECEDMEASLQKEIAGMKKQSQGRKQRFQAVESGAKNVAFIKSKIDDPSELVHRILTDIQETKMSKSRHIMRMLPVNASFRSYVEDIEKQAPQILKPHFECEDGQELSFCIMFKVRNCGHLKRDDVITMLHRIVTGMGKHRVDLKNADRVILVEGIRNVCCISVLKDFFKLRKYNLQAITEEFTDNTNMQGKGRWNRKSKKSGSKPTADAKEGDSKSDKEGNSSECKTGNDADGMDGDRDSAVADGTNGDKEVVVDDTDVDKESVDAEQLKAEGQDVGAAQNSDERTSGHEKHVNIAVDKNESIGKPDGQGDTMQSENKVDEDGTKEEKVLKNQEQTQGN